VVGGNPKSENGNADPHASLPPRSVGEGVEYAVGADCIARVTALACTLPREGIGWAKQNRHAGACRLVDNEYFVRESESVERKTTTPGKSASAVAYLHIESQWVRPWSRAFAVSTAMS
jgi:hypothetical protein